MKVSIIMDLPLNFVATLILGLLVVYPDATSGLDMESRESLPTESWISSYITWMKTDSIPHHPITAKHWKIHSRLRRAPNVVASSSPQHPIETDGGGVSTDMQFKHSTEYFPLPITSPTENRLVEKSTLKNMQVTHTNMSSTGSSGYSELPTSSIPSHTLEPQQSTHFTSMSTQESSSEQQEESQTELDSFTPESESTDDAETEDIETTLTDSSSDTNLENFVKKLMSNPKAADLDLKSTDTKEILRLLMKKRLLAQKMHDYAKNMDEAVIESWDTDSCLINETKFPTLNLISDNADFFSMTSGPTNGSRDIRINKFYGVKRDRFYVRNNGNGVLSFKFEPDELTSQATIRGPGWKEEYILAKGDIYWSLDDKHGAQHALNGKAFALEMQLVHYLKTLGSLEKASKNAEGVLVTSILFEATGRPSPQMEPLARSAMSVGFPNKRWKQVHGPIDLKMIYPVDMSYLTYNGPYIHEPCTKNALWFVFKTPLPVSFSQLQRFRELRKHNSQRCSGVFIPLSRSTDKSSDRAVKTSNGRVYLSIVPQETLTNGGRTRIPNSVIKICIAVIVVLQFICMQIT